LFKVRAKAVSGPERFDFGTGELPVRLPVIVQPALPRFVRPGDQFRRGGDRPDRGGTGGREAPSELGTPPSAQQEGRGEQDQSPHGFTSFSPIAVYGTAIDDPRGLR
jgi:hypothetical protein